MEDEIKYMEKHAPRCLESQIQPVTNNLKKILQDELGENSTVFSPICECSQNYMKIATSESWGGTKI